MMNKVWLLAAMVPMLANADTVYLKSGSFLKGEAGLIQDGKLSFKAEDFGEVKIDVKNITKLESAKTHIIQYNDDTRKEVALSVKDGEYVIGAEKVDMSQVKKTDPNIEKWHGSINGAYMAARGNTYENSWSIFGDVSRRWGSDRFNANGGYYYSETGTYDGDDKKRTTDRWVANAEHEHFWATKFFGFETLGFERDMIKGLRARYSVGLGPGYQWLDKENFEATGKWTFKQQLAVLWQREEHEDSDTDDNKNGYAALSYRHELSYIPKWNEDVEVFHHFKYDPEVDQWEKYRILADVGFSAKLIADFNFIGKIEWDYESKPANDRKNSDVRYIAGLGYKW